VRSLTKTWGLAGLRAGYVLAGAGDVDAMARARPPWAVSSPALAAVVACCEPRATEEAAAWAEEMNTERDRLTAILDGIPGVVVTAGARASFLLLHAGRADVRGDAPGAGGLSVRRNEPGAGGLSGRESSAVGARPVAEERPAGGLSVRERLRGAGFAVRRGDTFPGLGPDWLRVAVRDRPTNERFAAALSQIMRESDNDANT
jgi:histidinol-phosphate aminotransferase